MKNHPGMDIKGEDLYGQENYALTEYNLAYIRVTNSGVALRAFKCKPIGASANAAFHYLILE